MASNDPGQPAMGEELAARARSAIDELAASGDPESFSQLLALSQHVGEALGVAARHLAATNSWSGVGDYAGMSKQAAWARWSQH